MKTPDDDERPEPRASSRAKVLVADDEDEVREVFSEFLESEGFEVIQAVNGLEALLHVKRSRPSVVLLDLRMPRLGGLDALKRIRSFDPTIAVVILAGDVDPDVRREALALGARAVLFKPIGLRDLLAAVRG